MKLKISIILAVAMLLMAWQFSYAADKGNACDLLTKEEVEKTTAQKISAVEVQAGYGNCIFHTKVNIFGNVMNVPVVTVGYTRSDVQSRWNYWSSLKKKEVINGIGDGAIWAPEYDFFVCRVKGGLLMMTVGGSENDDKKKNMAIKLAKKAIERIRP